MTNGLALVAWMANTIHQAYHTDSVQSWNTCPKSICQAAAVYLAETGLTEKAELELLRKASMAAAKELDAIARRLETAASGGGNEEVP